MSLAKARTPLLPDPGPGVVELVRRYGTIPGSSVVVVLLSDAVETKCGVKPDGDGVVVLRVAKR